MSNFEKNVLYLFDFIQDKLIIGKFCQIATGVRFIMNGSNHVVHGVSTYPFKVFSEVWSDTSLEVLNKGDTTVGNDVWFGHSATIMPGVKIGSGAIIGANSLITKDVEPYTIVGGNPGMVIMKRFDDNTIDFLLGLNWWDWPIAKITDNVKLISAGNIEALIRVHSRRNTGHAVATERDEMTTTTQSMLQKNI